MKRAYIFIISNSHKEMIKNLCELLNVFKFFERSEIKKF